MNILKRFSMTTVFTLLLVTTSTFADKTGVAKASKQAETEATPASIVHGHKARCTAKPPARGYGLTTYDWSTGKLYLIGGVDEQTPDLSYPLRDVWVYNTFTRCWTLLLNSEEFFNAMQRDAMALDPRSEQIVLYATFVDPAGGIGWGVQTWIYDIRKNTFEDVTSGTEPPLRWGSRMVYDDESRRAILFGGTDGYTYTTLNDTWEFDFETKEWTQMTPSVKPPPHHFAAMAYHPLADRVVLFGGFDNETDTLLNDTWTYDYNENTWTEVDTAVSPPARLYHTLAWDVWSNRMILFGGVAKPYKPLFGDTWALDLEKKSWTQLSPSRKPHARAWHVMQGTWGGPLLFGGSPQHSPYTYDDTWIYKSYYDRWIPINVSKIPQDKDDDDDDVDDEDDED